MTKIADDSDGDVLDVGNVRYQQTFLDLIFARDPSLTLARIAIAPKVHSRYLVYRRMARARFLEVAQVALPRTLHLLGESFLTLWDEWLEASPPRTPFLREIPGEFGAWLCRQPAPSHAPVWLHELVAYEMKLDAMTFRECFGPQGSEQDVAGLPVSEQLDFSRPMVVSQAFELFSASHTVHRFALGLPLAVVESAPSHLLIYRQPSTFAAEAWELTPLAHALVLAVSADSTRPLVSACQAAADSLGVPIDGAFLETFSTLACDLLAAGVWLGSAAR